MLQDVLSLAAHWDALVLLDEGDALVEKRSRGQLLLNSMTGLNPYILPPPPSTLCPPDYTPHL